MSTAAPTEGGCLLPRLFLPLRLLLHRRSPLLAVVLVLVSVSFPRLFSPTLLSAQFSSLILVSDSYQVFSCRSFFPPPSHDMMGHDVMNDETCLALIALIACH